MTDREREIHRRVNERYLLTPAQQWANQQDAWHHADLERVRQMLAATEEAMAAEGIPLETRERVIYRLLYGDYPAGYEPIDWRDAATRAVDHDLAVQRLRSDATFVPRDLPPELFGEVSG